MYRDIFWFFGHPEVYIMILPATGGFSGLILAIAPQVVTIGAFGFGLMQVYFLFFVALPAYRGTGVATATDKPWDGAEGLEWTVPSPTPFHTFETPPLVE